MWPLLDKDKSGTVSLEEFVAFMKAKKKKKDDGRWEGMDKDGDGELTKQEGKDGQDRFSDDKVDDMWPLVDKDKSGAISFDEFVAFMKAKKKEADGCWERMDKDGDGELTKQEVKDGQDKFSDDVVDAMWPLLDKDKSGTISLEEFFTFMKGKKEEAYKHWEKKGEGWMR